ncbi:MAG TPA: glycosyltransferase [Flexilinea sp.]|nr:glycosyltransferase [Flexilinea sp.]HOW06436.1 glycosyltransferase [Flexilinea sp.]HPS47021.1 glycosyltransferase [Flexilinea sp.]
MDQPEISVIIPFLNEEENLPDLIAELEAFAPTMPVRMEVVFVDDGSTDGSLALLRKAHFRNFSAKIVKLSRNFGSHPAVRAGFLNAGAPNCVWLGADLQEPLEIIRLGYQKIREGYDLVCVQKKNVKVGKSEKLFSHTYSRLIRKYAIPGYPPDGVNTVFFNEKVKRELNRNIESNSSVVLQVLNLGFKQTTLDVEYRERVHGRSKWSFGKKMKLMIDSFVAFSFFPIRMVSAMGFIFAIIGAIIALYLIIIKLFNIKEVTLGWPSLISILMIGFGITNISLGVIAEYLWRTLDAARGRPSFIIESVEGLSQANQND